jgi:tetratricopeptide (TPR) repeat protein
MTEDKIKDLLQEADRTAGQPAGVRVDLSAIRRRAKRRRFASLAAPVVAAAVLMVALGIWSLTIRVPKATQEQKRVVALENQIKQLQASTDAALSLIHEVLEDERRQRRLEELEAQRASIPDPLAEIQKQVDKTAFILVYQADRLYRELNLTDSAVEAYNRVIELFPENRWAAVARQRLSEIESRRINKSDS